MEVVDFKNTVWDLLRDISENMNSVFQPSYEAYGLTVMQVRILLEIHMHKEQTIGGLGKNIGVAGANISSMCKKLENEGFLKRIRDKDDERVVKVDLSDKGRKIIIEVEESLQNKCCPILNDESKESLEQIIIGLQKLNLLFKKMNEINSALVENK